MSPLRQHGIDSSPIVLNPLKFLPRVGIITAQPAVLEANNDLVELEEKILYLVFNSINRDASWNNIKLGGLDGLRL